VTASVVVGSVLLATDEQLGVEKLAVLTGTDLVNWRWVQIDKDGAWHVLAAASLGEESLVGAAFDKVGRVGIGAAVGLQSVFEQVQLPGAVTKLYTSLADLKMANLRSIVSHSRVSQGLPCSVVGSTPPPPPTPSVRLHTSPRMMDGSRFCVEQTVEGNQEEARVG